MRQKGGARGQNNKNGNIPGVLRAEMKNRIYTKTRTKIITPQKQTELAVLTGGDHGHSGVLDRGGAVAVLRLVRLVRNVSGGYLEYGCGYG